jgi:hypothetical protein
MGAADRAVGGIAVAPWHTVAHATAEKLPSMPKVAAGAFRAGMAGMRIAVAFAALALVACSSAHSAVSAADAGTLVLVANGGASGQVSADVALTEPGVGQSESCGAPAKAGSCQLTTCTLGGIGSPGGGYGDFGPITASVGTTTETLTYNDDGYGTVDFPSSVTLGTGGTMIFQGGGSGSVPSFDVSVTIPGLGVLTSPVPTTDGGTATIDTSQDLTVRWEPISVGEINFVLSAEKEASLGAGGTATTIACTFGGAAGSGTISQTLLSSMKEMGANMGSPYASLSSELQATTVMGGLTIMTDSYQNSQTAGHSVKVTLQ